MQPEFIAPELLEAIFQLLARKDLLQCAFVCRSWQVPANRLCYKNLTLSKNLPQLVSLLQKQSAGSSFGDNVRTITLKFQKNQLPEKHFLKMLSYLVSLKEVVIQKNFETRYYLDCLSKGSKFLQLEKIDPGENTPLVKEYLKCAYLYRPSLKHICLMSDWIKQVKEHFDQDPVQFIKEFIQLRSIKIINADDLNGLISVRVLDLLQACPDIINFTLVNRFPEAEVEKNQLLPVIRHHSLKNVKLRICELNLSCMDYILSSFPSYLDSFSITLTDTDSSKWLTSYGELAMQDFGCCLGKAKEMDIAIINYNKPFEIDYTSNSYNTVSSYGPFIEAIRGQRELMTHVSVEIRNIETLKASTNMEIMRNQRNMYIGYSLDKTEFINQDKKSIYSVLPTNMIPNQKVDSFELSINNRAITSDVLVDILDSLLKNCSRIYFIMYTFVMHGECILKFGSDAYVCDMNVDHSFNFLNLETRRHLTCDSFKYVLLENVTISSTVFKDIMDLLPETKVLKLIPCRVIQDVQRNTHLDLTGINYLDEFVLNLYDDRYMQGSAYCVDLHLENVTRQNISHYRISFSERQLEYQPCNDDVVCDHINEQPLDSAVIIKYRQIKKLTISVCNDQPKAYIYPG